MRKLWEFMALAAILGTAPAGATVVISTAATQNMNCSSGTCAPTATDAVLNVSDLESYLASGNISVVTTNGSIQADNIRVSAALTWASSSALSFDAYHSILIDQPVSVQGAGGLVLVTNDGGTLGELNFGKHGNVSFANLATALTINGAIYTLENALPALASAMNGNPSGNYALAASYDASGDGTYGTSPVDQVFEGKLEGLGNSISRLSINNTGALTVALVGESSGTIENLHLVRVSVTGSYTTAGGTHQDVAGLVAKNDGTVENASVSGKITYKIGNQLSGFAGGLVGHNTADGSISGSSSTADVIGIGKTFYEVIAGGLVGADDGTIVRSYATGNVVSPPRGRAITYSELGGFAGYVSGTTDQNFSTGSVTCHTEGCGTGGFAGSVYGDTSNSYSTGAVTEGAGFAWGASNGSLTSSYETGLVTGITGPGFICVRLHEHIANSYWDTTTSGQNEGACRTKYGKGITGLTSEELQSGLPAGFKPKIWAEDPDINNGFPYLINNPPPK